MMKKSKIKNYPLGSKAWLDNLDEFSLEELTVLRGSLESLIRNSLKKLGDTFQWYKDYEKLSKLVEKELGNKSEENWKNYCFRISLVDLQEYLDAYFAVIEKIKEKIKEKINKKLRKNKGKN